MHRSKRVGPGVGEQRALPEEGDERRVADDAREHGRDERVGLEVVAVEHLYGEERRAERRAEHRGHAGGRAGHEQDAALAIGDAKRLPDVRADGAAHLHRRPLSPAGAAHAKREDGDDRLHEGDALAHDPAVLVKRLDDGVASSAERLGSEAHGDDPREERSDRGEDEQQPRAEARVRRDFTEDSLARGA